MKKMKLVFLTLLATLFVSCTVNYDEKQGSLCVRNEAFNTSLNICEVYVKEKGSSGYERIWTGNLASGSSEFISLDEGMYSVKIAVSNYPGFILYEYTSGYNVYKKVNADDCIYVSFDGNGIYFED